MPTPLELKLIHLAYRQAGLDEAQYHLISAMWRASRAQGTHANEPGGRDGNPGGQRLSPCGQAGGLLAIQGGDARIVLRGAMEGKIKALAAQQTYDLPGLCRRFSDDRVARVDKLMPREAHRLIEALKAICARQASAEAWQGRD